MIVGRCLGAVLVTGLAAAPAAAQSPVAAPLSRVPVEQVPLPPPRPDDAKAPATQEPSAKEPSAKEPAVKEPAVKEPAVKETGPDGRAPRTTATETPAPVPDPAPLPPERPADIPSGPALTPATSVPDDTACLRRLERLGAKAEPVAALADGMCGAAKPLRVTELPDGVGLAPAATLTCTAAEALVRWSTEVRVIAERSLGKAPQRFQIGGSYECRGQNHDPSAKLSEHSYANGVDVMGFAFDGRAPIAVGTTREGTPEAAFEAAIRARACGFFRTVLGPGSDAAHANHLHLDERERPAGHRLCQ
ncbi:extensin [Methylobacterium terricola]|uniref:Extensin n=2 Tax=Methylobacterium terricola TaxID=2583531 RepID=A0A5C4L791_9HYPH|nr:extensin [Methylobacterium terricola]